MSNVNELEEVRRIGFVGAGNVAIHLSSSLLDAGYEVCALVNRDASKRGMLPDRLVSLLTQDLEVMFSRDPDLVIIAVGDGSIADVAESIGRRDVGIVHTSGAVPINSLETTGDHYGSFYPLQTLTADASVDMRTVPICVYASSEKLRELLFQVAWKISDMMYSINDEQRRWLHLAAVMMNNNINHLLARVRDIMDHADLPPEMLYPLLEETVRKSYTAHPRTIQTGPARRGDENTYAIHTELLNDLDGEPGFEGMRALYDYFWRSIQEYYGKDIP